MAEGGEIIEGFLCPICKADLGSPKSLETHFQEEHNEDQDVIKSIKGLLGKAKKKILKLEDEELPGEFGTATLLSESFEIFYEPQEIGVVRSHTEYFRVFRGARLERYSAETNKLLIRLSKLLQDLPTDPVKRKQHEQAIVPWIDERDVKLCPNCAKSFHVARRKHHCRLCGAVMCNECSQFLELPIAKKMTGSGFGHDLSSSSSLATSKSKSTSSGSLEHSSSVSSLSSVRSFVDNMTGDQNLRLCVHCKQLLEARERLKENRSQKPIISQFYDRLSSYIREADEMAEHYVKMCESLQFGETSYTAEEAQILRAKLLKLAENIDSLSKKITILGTKDVENPPKGKSLQLQNMIRAACVAYLKEKLFGLSLPIEGQRSNHR